jgi:hypothetical protein
MRMRPSRQVKRTASETEVAPLVFAVAQVFGDHALGIEESLLRQSESNAVA